MAPVIGAVQEKTSGYEQPATSPNPDEFPDDSDSSNILSNDDAPVMVPWEVHVVTMSVQFVSCSLFDWTLRLVSKFCFVSHIFVGIVLYVCLFVYL